MENENNEVLDDTDEMEASSPSTPQDDSLGSDPPGESETGSGESGADQQEGDGQLLDENGELLEGEELQEAPACVTAEELKEIVYGSIEEYFSMGMLNVSVQENPAGVTAEEWKEIVYGSIEEYFSTEVINVSVQEKGIDVPLEDLGLRDALLFVLVLVALGHAVSEIIGGKLKWRK